MTDPTVTPPLTLPFGRHKGQPLADVPSGYLRWCLDTCKLSSGLRLALVEELQARGVEVAMPPPSPLTVRGCHRCPTAGVALRWQQDRLGRRHIRAGCSTCDGFIVFVPSRPPFAALADTPQEMTTVG
jgi:uncharacterized protein (DUF3820 family)